MTDFMGHLLWMKVGMKVDLTHEALAALLQGTGAQIPSRPIPVDVFRRLGNETKTYDLMVDDEPYTLECSTAPVDSRNEHMLLRHMVGTVHNKAGVVQSVQKLGDVAFFKPPRAQHSKARIRVAVGHSPFTVQAADFADHLRAYYSRGIKGALDSQAIRRVVRTYLSERGAVYLDGPYFMENETQCAALQPLFRALGKDSFMHTVPLVDTPEQREFVARATSRATS